jgi:hypothetical protein
MLELKKMMFQSLQTWRIAWNSLLVSNFSEFLKFCSFSIFYEFSCMLHILRLHPYALLMNLHY